jgi:archaellum component FlaC
MTIKNLKYSITIPIGTLITLLIISGGVVYALTSSDFSSKASTWAKANCTSSLATAKASTSNELTATTCYSYNKSNENTSSINGLQTSYNSLNSNLSSLGNTVTGYGQQLSSQLQSILGLQNGINSFSGFGNQLNSQSQSIASLQKDVSTHTNQINSLNSQINSIQSSISGLSSNVDSHQVAIQNLQGMTIPRIYDGANNLIGYLLNLSFDYGTGMSFNNTAVYNPNLNRYFKLQLHDGNTVSVITPVDEGFYTEQNCAGQEYFDYTKLLAEDNSLFVGLRQDYKGNYYILNKDSPVQRFTFIFGQPAQIQSVYVQWTDSQWRVHTECQNIDKSSYYQMYLFPGGGPNDQYITPTFVNLGFSPSFTVSLTQPANIQY